MALRDTSPQHVRPPDLTHPSDAQLFVMGRVALDRETEQARRGIHDREIQREGVTIGHRHRLVTGPRR